MPAVPQGVLGILLYHHNSGMAGVFFLESGLDRIERWSNVNAGIHVVPTVMNGLKSCTLWLPFPHHHRSESAVVGTGE